MDLDEEYDICRTIFGLENARGKKYLLILTTEKYHELRSSTERGKVLAVMKLIIISLSQGFESWVLHKSRSSHALLMEKLQTPKILLQRERKRAQ